MIVVRKKDLYFLIKENEKVYRTISGLDPLIFRDIKTYLQDRLEKEIINVKSTKWFLAKDLIPKQYINDWHETPLGALYDNRKNDTKCENPEAQAGIDMGWIVKEILNESPHTFERQKKKIKNNQFTNCYRFVLYSK